MGPRGSRVCPDLCDLGRSDFFDRSSDLFRNQGADIIGPDAAKAPVIKIIHRSVRRADDYAGPGILHGAEQTAVILIAADQHQFVGSEIPDKKSDLLFYPCEMTAEHLEKSGPGEKQADKTGCLQHSEDPYILPVGIYAGFKHIVVNIKTEGKQFECAEEGLDPDS